MDGFSDAFNNVNNNGNGEVDDPAAEFLAREQDTLGGLDDDFKPVVSNGPSSSAIEEDYKGFTTGDNEIDSGFEMINHSADASLSTNNNIGNNINDNGVGFDMRDEPVDSSSPTPLSQPQIIREEPEKIKRWREEQAKRLAKKDDEEEDKKHEMKEAAKKELEEWYKNHEEQVAKTRKTNRSAEKELVADTEPMEPGTEWERIAKLCDFNPKGSKHQKDISRMRSIILKVKQNQPQPNQFVSQHPPPNNHVNNGQ